MLKENNLGVQRLKELLILPLLNKTKVHLLYENYEKKLIRFKNILQVKSPILISEDFTSNNLQVVLSEINSILKNLKLAIQQAKSIDFLNNQLKADVEDYYKSKIILRTYPNLSSEIEFKYDGLCRLDNILKYTPSCHTLLPCSESKILLKKRHLYLFDTCLIVLKIWNKKIVNKICLTDFTVVEESLVPVQENSEKTLTAEGARRSALEPIKIAHSKQSSNISESWVNQLDCPDLPNSDELYHWEAAQDTDNLEQNLTQRMTEPLILSSLEHVFYLKLNQPKPHQSNCYTIQAPDIETKKNWIDGIKDLQRKLTAKIKTAQVNALVVEPTNSKTDSTVDAKDRKINLQNAPEIEKTEAKFHKNFEFKLATFENLDQSEQDLIQTYPNFQNLDTSDFNHSLPIFCGVTQLVIPGLYFQGFAIYQKLKQKFKKYLAVSHAGAEIFASNIINLQTLGLVYDRNYKILVKLKTDTLTHQRTRKTGNRMGTQSSIDWSFPPDEEHSSRPSESVFTDHLFSPLASRSNFTSHHSSYLDDYDFYIPSATRLNFTDFFNKKYLKSGAFIIRKSSVFKNYVISLIFDDRCNTTNNNYKTRSLPLNRNNSDPLKFYRTEHIVIHSCQGKYNTSQKIFYSAFFYF